MSSREYGTRGQAQYGIDLLAPLQEGLTHAVAQCKCYREFGLSAIKQASDEFFAHYDHWATWQIRRFILIVACDMRATQRQNAIKAERERFAVENIVYDVWDATTIQQKLAPEPRIVARHLGTEWVPILCGQTEGVRDVIKVFVGRYETLQDAYIPADPTNLFRSLDLKTYTGRTWLEAKVDQFLQEGDSGYLILEASAGWGKTAFLAHLVQKHRYIHLFSGLLPGQANLERALKGLVAQIIVSWRLESYLIEGVLPEVASHHSFLERVLAEAAQQRDHLEPGRKIIIVIDALDEAGEPVSTNVLGLPRLLPPGVYIICSRRPKRVELRGESRRICLNLDAEEVQSNNNEDIRSFLEREITDRPAITRILTDEAINHDQFVATVLEKSQGNWMYLVHMLRDIEHMHTLDLERLPDGLRDYYDQFWMNQRRSDLDKWYDLHLPVLATLTALREDATPTTIHSFAGVRVNEGIVRQLLEQDWRPFLIEIPAETSYTEAKYRLYHATLRDFLEGRNWPRSTNTQAALTGDLREDLRRALLAAHAYIADYYFNAWGGIENNLPGLSHEHMQNIHGGYALRYLVSHLEAAHRHDDLHRLLGIETTAQAGNDTPRLAWFKVFEQRGEVGPYLRDLEKAWALVDGMGINATHRSYALALQGRYALIKTSIHSVAELIPDELRLAALKHGVWQVEHGLSYALQIPDSEQRAKAIADLIPYSSSDLDLVRQAAFTINPTAEVQSRALGELVLLFIKHSRFTESLEVIAAIRNEDYRARSIVALLQTCAVLNLPDTTRIIQESTALAEAITAAEPKAIALLGVLRYGQLPLSEDLVQKTFDAIEAVTRPEARQLLLSHVARYLSPLLLNHVLQQLDLYVRHTAKHFLSFISNLIERLDELGAAEVASQLRSILQDAFEALPSESDFLMWDAKRLICSHLPITARKIDAMLTSHNLHPNAEDLQDWYIFIADQLLQSPGILDLLVAGGTPEDTTTNPKNPLTPIFTLNDELAQQAFEKARVIQNPQNKSWALIVVAAYLPEPKKTACIEEAIAAAKEIEGFLDSTMGWVLLLVCMYYTDRPALQLKTLRTFLQKQIGHISPLFTDDLLTEVIPHLSQACLNDLLEWFDSNQSGVLHQVLRRGLGDRGKTMFEDFSTAIQDVPQDPDVPLQDLLEAVRTRRTYPQTRSFAQLLLYVPPRTVHERLENARLIDDRKECVRILSRLAASFTDSNDSREILSAALALASEADAAEAITTRPIFDRFNVVDRLQVDNALLGLCKRLILLQDEDATRQVANYIHMTSLRKLIIVVLAASSRLTGPQIEALLNFERELLVDESEVNNSSQTVVPLSSLQKTLSYSLSVIHALFIRNPLERVRRLIEITMILPNTNTLKTLTLRIAYHAVRQLPRRRDVLRLFSTAHEDENVATICELAMQLIEQGQFEAAVKIVAALHDHEERAVALLTVIPQLQEVKAKRASEKAIRITLKTARSINHLIPYIETVTGIAWYLPERERADRLWEAAQTINDVMQGRSRIVAYPFGIDSDWFADVESTIRPVLKQAIQKAKAGRVLEGLASLFQDNNSRGILDDRRHTISSLELLSSVLPRTLVEQAIDVALTGNNKEVAQALFASSLAPIRRNILLTALLSEGGPLAEEFSPVFPTAISEPVWDWAWAFADLAPVLSSFALTQWRISNEGMFNKKWPKEELQRRLDVALQQPRSPRLPEQALRLALTITSQLDPEGIYISTVRPSLSAGLAELGHFHEALNLVNSLTNRVEQIYAVVTLLPVLIQRGEYDQSILTIGVIEDPGVRARLLIAMAPRLPQKLIYEAQSAVAMLEPSGMKALLLSTLARYTHAEERTDMLEQTLAIARKTRSQPYYRTLALAALSQMLPESQRCQTLEEAKMAAADIIDAWKRALVLGFIALQSPVPQRVIVLGEAFTAACLIENNLDRSAILMRLLSQTTELNDIDQYTLVRNLLHSLASRTRSELASDLETLSPVLTSLGGSRGLAGLFKALIDCRRWFP